MRRALTLIELIFTMVIVGLVFLTVPKIVFVSNQSMRLQIKEDGIFDAVSLMGQVRRVAWDAQTIAHNGAILRNDLIDCQDGKPANDTADPLIGQRICVDSDPDNSADGNCDDLDDFTAGCHDSATGGRMDYNLSVALSMDANQTQKTLRVTVATDDARAGGHFGASFFYRSYNIGWASIERRWMP